MHTTKLFLLVALTLALSARENPFAPVENFGSEPLTKPIPVPDFNRTTIVPIIQAATCQVAPPPEKKEPPKPKVSKPKLPPKATPAPLVQTPPKVPHTKRVHRPLHKKVLRYQTLYRDENLKISVKGNRIKIVTDDTLIKHFRLRSPQRIVLDFGDDFIIYPSIDKRLHSPYLRRLKIGTHPCFYRVTFELKKRRSYRVKRLVNGYLITLL